MTSYIGTYGEKALHRNIKWRIDPTGACHEVPIGRYIADIRTDAGITEIQTKSFHKLRAKLAAFLPEHIVTVVYPLAREKQIVWVDAESGEIIRSRRSPKRGSFYNAFRELYQIKQLLTDGNLRLRLILLDVTEQRTADDSRRKRYSLLETEVRDVCDELYIGRADDYSRLIPPPLTERFTTRDYASASGVNTRDAGTALNVLYYVGAVERVGKQGRYYLYSRK